MKARTFLSLRTIAANALMVTAFFVLAFVPHSAMAATNGLSGYAWSSTIGWVSMSGSNYGVSVSSAGAMSGDAWSPNVGWISFNNSDLTGCPSGTCSASFNQSTGVVSGWARAIAGEDTNTQDTGGWGGWIHLAGSNYGVTANGCNWSGDAWGGGPDSSSGVIGWLQFSGSNYAVTGSGYACATTTSGPVSAMCSPSPTSATTGQTVTWTATPSGGNGTYTYVWSGSNGLTGTTQSVTTSYAIAGTYNASVKVTSNGTSATVTCSTPVTVTTTGLPDLTAGAITPTYAQEGVLTTFSATISNIGNASTGIPFTDLFQVANNSTGAGAIDIATYANPVLAAGATNVASFTYKIPNAAGVIYGRACADKKSASQSGGVTESNSNNNCGPWTAITIGVNPPVGASCSVSPTTATTGQSVTWTATASGGTGTYTYLWGGNVSGTTKTVSTSYPSAGTYTGQVTVTSGGQSVAPMCTNSVTVTSCTPSLTANPSSITLGGTSKLTWSEAPSCATSCVFSDGVTVGLSGTRTVVPPAPTTGNTDTYAITCNGNTANTTITVNTPVATITVGPVGSANSTETRIANGGTAEIDWNATDVTACTITKNGVTWLTPTVTKGSTSGSQTDSVNGQAIYQIICSPGAVSAKAQVDIVPSFQNF